MTILEFTELAIKVKEYETKIIDLEDTIERLSELSETVGDTGLEQVLELINNLNIKRLKLQVKLDQVNLGLDRFELEQALAK